MTNSCSSRNNDGERACRNLCKSKFIYLFKPDIYLQYLCIHNMILLFIVHIITFIEEMREGISIKKIADCEFYVYG